MKTMLPVVKLLVFHLVDRARNELAKMIGFKKLSIISLISRHDEHVFFSFSFFSLFPFHQTSLLIVV